MTRNRGKRPGTAPGPTARASAMPGSSERTGPDAAAGGAQSGTAAAPVPADSASAATSSPEAIGAASSAPGPKPAPISGPGVAGAPSGSPGAGSAGGPRPPAAGGPAATPRGGAVPDRAAGASTGGASTGGAGTGGAGGFWPGLLGGLTGGAAVVAATLYYGVGSGDDDAVLRLQSTAAELTDRLAAAEGEVEQLGSLAERVDAIEAAPSPAAADGERLAGIEQRLTDLAGAIEAAKATSESASSAVAALKDALPTIETTLAATGTTIEATNQQTTALATAVEQLNQTADRLGGEVDKLAARVGEAEARLDHFGGEYQRAAAMVVAIGDVDRAIGRAEGYASPLASLQGLAQDDPAVGAAIATLEPMAAEGVPTLAALQERFGAVASRVLAAEDGNGSLADKVSDNLLGIINMRPAGGEVEGESARAILARAQAKLSANDLDGTITELGALDGAAAEAAAPWIEQARARLAAEAAIVDLRAHAQSLLAKGS